MINVLLVEDNRDMISVLKEVMCDFNVFISLDSDSAIDIFNRHQIDIVLLDIHLPNSKLDGMELCRTIKKIDKNIPIIIMSGCGHNHRSHCFESGACDVLEKPLDIEELVFKITTHSQNYHIGKELGFENIKLKNSIIDSHKKTLVALAKLTEYRDDHTGKHLERVSKYSCILAEKLSKEAKYSEYIDSNYIENLKYASVLHDIGKVGVPDNVLLKPARLTKEEFEVIKKHTTIGADTLEGARDIKNKNTIVSMAIEVCRHHHENWDGSGYPSGLSGEDIPLSARIVSIVDFYDAVSNNRVYRAAMLKDEYIKLMEEQRGIKFESDILDTFFEIFKNGGFE